MSTPSDRAGIASRDPDVHGGDLVWAGTRVPVDAVLDAVLADGGADWQAGYPSVVPAQLAGLGRLLLAAAGAATRDPDADLRSEAVARIHAAEALRAWDSIGLDAARIHDPAPHASPAGVTLGDCVRADEPERDTVYWKALAVLVGRLGERLADCPRGLIEDAVYVGDDAGRRRAAAGAQIVLWRHVAGLPPSGSHGA